MNPPVKEEEENECKYWAMMMIPNILITGFDYRGMQKGKMSNYVYLKINTRIGHKIYGHVCVQNTQVQTVWLDSLLCSKHLTEQQM